MTPVTPALFDFLRDLAANNERAWFQANRDRYEADVVRPMLDFVAAFAAPLAEISPHFRADPRRNGGSMFRIHRDVRFARDKSPYKTNVGAQFRHAMGKDVHAPAFYLHLAPGECFAAAGVWRPDSGALGRIRDALVERPATWTRIVSAPAFRSTLRLAGESLKRAPRGYDPAHPLVSDLKRKDFVAVADLLEEDVVRSGFLEEFARIARAAAPFMAFLCQAIGVPFGSDDPPPTGAEVDC